MAKQFVAKILCLSFCLSFSACGSSYPADTGGGTVSGTIFYQGDTHKNIDNVGLAINAFAAAPTTATTCLMPACSSSIPNFPQRALPINSKA